MQNKGKLTIMKYFRACVGSFLVLFKCALQFYRELYFVADLFQKQDYTHVIADVEYLPSPQQLIIIYLYNVFCLLCKI